MKLSVVILTKNEQENIEKALKSVLFADEIIIIDDNSIDETLDIAKKYTSNIIKKSVSGNFSNQRNYGIQKSKGEWILFLDADEEVTYELKNEIQLFLKSEMNYSCVYIKRRDYWWGKELKYGEVQKVYKNGLIRLIKRNSGKWEGLVHEKYLFDGLSLKLNSFIKHYPHPTIRQFIEDINFYSNMRAIELKDNNKKTNVFDISFTPLFKFIDNYFFKLGFLDGVQGFVYSFLMSFHSFLVRAKLYRLNKFSK